MLNFQAKSNAFFSLLPINFKIIPFAPSFQINFLSKKVKLFSFIKHKFINAYPEL